MKALCAALLLFTASSFGFAQSQSTWDGFVTDTHCGTNCQRTSTMTPDRACVRRCISKDQSTGFGMAIMSMCWSLKRRLPSLPLKTYV